MLLEEIEMANFQHLTNADKKLFMMVADTLSLDSDTRDSLWRETTTADYARGYLASISKEGSDRIVLLTYFMSVLMSSVDL